MSKPFEAQYLKLTSPKRPEWDPEKNGGWILSSRKSADGKSHFCLVKGKKEGVYKTGDHFSGDSIYPTSSVWVEDKTSTVEPPRAIVGASEMADRELTAFYEEKEKTKAEETVRLKENPVFKWFSSLPSDQQDALLGNRLGWQSKTDPFFVVPKILKKL